MNTNQNNIINDDQKSALQKGAVILACEVSGSTGERTIPDSSGYFEGDVLKNENVSKSSIRWMPRDLIRFRNRINGAAQRVLTENGVSYYGGATLLPAAQLQAVESELNDLQDEFNLEVDKLEASLDMQVESHKAANPDIANLIERFRESGQEFARKFKFRVMPPTNLDFVNGNASEAVAKDMADQLIEEAAKEAAAIFKKTWSVAEKATAQTLKSVQKLHRKLSNLSFMDESIEPIAEAFEDALNSFPKAFPVTGEPVQKMAKFIAAASNPDTLRNFGTEADVEAEEVEILTPESPEQSSTVESEPEVEEQQPTEQPQAEQEKQEVKAEALKAKKPEVKPAETSAPKAVTKPTPAPSNDDDEDDGLGWGGF